MIEVGVLFDRDHQPIFWHEPPGRSTVSIPDSRTLWEVLWEHRERVLGFAHSHPGRGVPSPSHEDLTTFAAVERALGKCLEWWIVTESDAGIVSVTTGRVESGYDQTPWLVELRRRSYIGG